MNGVLVWLCVWHGFQAMEVDTNLQTDVDLAPSNIGNGPDPMPMEDPIIRDVQPSALEMDAAVGEVVEKDEQFYDENKQKVLDLKQVEVQVSEPNECSWTETQTGENALLTVGTSFDCNEKSVATVNWEVHLDKKLLYLSLIYLNQHAKTGKSCKTALFESYNKFIGPRVGTMFLEQFTLQFAAGKYGGYDDADFEGRTQMAEKALHCYSEFAVSLFYEEVRFRRQTLGVGQNSKSEEGAWFPLQATNVIGTGMRAKKPDGNPVGFRPDARGSWNWKTLRTLKSIATKEVAKDYHKKGAEIVAVPKTASPFDIWRDYIDFSRGSEEGLVLFYMDFRRLKFVEKTDTGSPPNKPSWKSDAQGCYFRWSVASHQSEATEFLKNSILAMHGLNHETLQTFESRQEMEEVLGSASLGTKDVCNAVDTATLQKSAEKHCGKSRKIEIVVSDKEYYDCVKPLLQHIATKALEAQNIRDKGVFNSKINQFSACDLASDGKISLFNTPLQKWEKTSDSGGAWENFQKMVDKDKPIRMIFSGKNEKHTCYEGK